MKLNETTIHQLDDQNKNGASLCFVCSLVSLMAQLLVPCAKEAAGTVPEWRATGSTTFPGPCQAASVKTHLACRYLSCTSIQRFIERDLFWGRGMLKHCAWADGAHDGICKHPSSSPELGSVLRQASASKTMLASLLSLIKLVNLRATHITVSCTARYVTALSAAWHIMLLFLCKATAPHP